MCWITNEKWRTRPRIAKKKIEVWKVYIKRSYVNQDELLVSPYQREKIFLSMRNKPLSIGYNLNVINRLQFFIKVKDWEIWQGYHSYKKGCLRLTQTEHVDIIQFCYKNYHHYIPEEYTNIKKFGNKYVVVKCHIPVGAEYYINEYGHYVSNKIIVGDIIPDEDLLQH